MRYPELVVSGDLGIRDLLPLGAANEMLCLEEWVAEDVWVGGHLDKVFSRHVLPELVEEGSVVDSQFRCDALGEPLPVLGVVAVCPLEAGSHAAEHFFVGWEAHVGDC